MAALFNIVVLVVFALFDEVIGGTCEGAMQREDVICPITKTEWDKRAREINCELKYNETCQSKFVYHCVLNQRGTGMVEVCAQTWFISGYCAMFSRDEKRIKNNFSLDCTQSNKPCPSRYISTDAYKYQSCYNVSSTNRSGGKKAGSFQLMTAIIAGVISLLVFSALVALLALFFRILRQKKANKEETIDPVPIFLEELVNTHGIRRTDNNQSKEDYKEALLKANKIPGYRECPTV
ncbi:uncharacterized protein LOC134236527 [Saccostrea cucullata]|uniref:uncharacterized protein LOC134236527 n=1 Tax=Saccostrea cuccullata TaxID=36930 RepID=UPI002ED2371C